MLFNSYIFILVFLPILLVIYYLINKIAKTNKPMLGLIIIASFIFYAYNNYKYLLVLIASILANWCIVSGMRRVSWRKLCMIIGIVFYMLLGTENAQRKELKYSIKSAVGVAVLLVWAVTSLAGVSTFLYFNF